MKDALVDDLTEQNIELVQRMARTIGELDILKITIEDSKKTKKELEKKYDAAVQRNQGTKKAYTTLSAERDKLKKENVDYAGKYKTVEKELQAANDEKTALNDKFTQREALHRKIQGLYDAVQAEYDELQDEAEKLKRENTQFATLIKQLKDDNAEATSRCADLKKRNTKLKKDYDSVIKDQKKPKQAKSQKVDQPAEEKEFRLCPYPLTMHGCNLCVRCRCQFI